MCRLYKHFETFMTSSHRVCVSKQFLRKRFRTNYSFYISRKFYWGELTILGGGIISEGQILQFRIITLQEFSRLFSLYWSIPNEDACWMLT